jgi:hypothetical protein
MAQGLSNREIARALMLGGTDDPDPREADELDLRDRVQARDLCL